MIAAGKKGERYSPRFQFQVVVEVLKEDREAVEIMWAHSLRPTTVARWKKEGSAVGFPHHFRCSVVLRQLGAVAGSPRR